MNLYLEIISASSASN